MRPDAARGAGITGVTTAMSQQEWTRVDTARRGASPGCSTPLLKSDKQLPPLPTAPYSPGLPAACRPGKSYGLQWYIVPAAGCLLLALHRCRPEKAPARRAVHPACTRNPQTPLSIMSKHIGIIFEQQNKMAVDFVWQKKTDLKKRF